jgi:hypothetical protein
VPELSDLAGAANAGLRSPGSTCAGKGEIAVCGHAAYGVKTTIAPASAAGENLILQLLGTKDT